jgi:hypothetical protein
VNLKLAGVVSLDVTESSENIVNCLWKKGNSQDVLDIKQLRYVVFMLVCKEYIWDESCLRACVCCEIHVTFEVEKCYLKYNAKTLTDTFIFQTTFQQQGVITKSVFFLHLHKEYILFKKRNANFMMYWFWTKT